MLRFRSMISVLADAGNADPRHVTYEVGMSVQPIYYGTLALVLLWGNFAVGQNPPPAIGFPGLPADLLGAPKIDASLAPEIPKTKIGEKTLLEDDSNPPQITTALDRIHHSPAGPWAYHRIPDCCPTGDDGPIGTHLWFRTGVSIVRGGELADRLKAGWDAGIGGRSLFFNPAGDAAWAMEFHIIYTHNYVKNGLPPVLFDNNLFEIRGLTRTYFGLGFGRDWWFYGPGAVGMIRDKNWHFGVDHGIRLGSSHVDLNLAANESVHERSQALMGSYYLGCHASVDVPMGGWTWTTGFRFEASYTWMNPIAGIDNNLFDYRFLFQTGVQF